MHYADELSGGTLSMLWWITSKISTWLTNNVKILIVRKDIVYKVPILFTIKCMMSKITIIIVSDLV